MNILIINAKMKSWNHPLFSNTINILIIIAKFNLIIIAQNYFIY